MAISKWSDFTNRVKTTTRAAVRRCKWIKARWLNEKELLVTSRGHEMGSQWPHVATQWLADVDTRDRVYRVWSGSGKIRINRKTYRGLNCSVDLRAPREVVIVLAGVFLWSSRRERIIRSTPTVDGGNPPVIEIKKIVRDGESDVWRVEERFGPVIVKDYVWEGLYCRINVMETWAPHPHGLRDYYEEERRRDTARRIGRAALGPFFKALEGIVTGHVGKERTKNDGE